MKLLQKLCCKLGWHWYSSYDGYIEKEAKMGGKIIITKRKCYDCGKVYETVRWEE